VLDVRTDDAATRPAARDEEREHDRPHFVTSAGTYAFQH
jgi:hypothetical protein